MIPGVRNLDSNLTTYNICPSWYFVHSYLVFYNIFWINFCSSTSKFLLLTICFRKGIFYFNPRILSISMVFFFLLFKLYVFENYKIVTAFSSFIAATVAAFLAQYFRINFFYLFCYNITFLHTCYQNIFETEKTYPYIHTPYRSAFLYTYILLLSYQ